MLFDAPPKINYEVVRLLFRSATLLMNRHRSKKSNSKDVP